MWSESVVVRLPSLNLPFASGIRRARGRRRFRTKGEEERRKPAPKKSDGFPDAKRVKTRNGRARWRTSDGKILEWDSQHGDIEVINRVDI